MQKRRLGNSDLDITVLGVGAWAMGGGDWKFSWGPQNDSDSVAAIHAALDAGMNWIDTAPVYGLGHAEEVVGRAVKDLSLKPLLFTKCARVWNEQREIGRSLKRDSIFRECEASLRRLQVEAIDLYQIHWPEPDEDIEEGWEACARLKEQGKVRWIGTSNFSVSQLERAWKLAPVTSLQPPYNLLVRGIEQEQLPWCQAHGVGVLAYSPMRSGLLTGKMTKERIAAMPADDHRQRVPDFQEPRLSRNLEFVELLRGIGAKHGCSAGEVAIAWTIRNPSITAAIVGMRNAAQAKGVLGAATLSLTNEDIAAIEGFDFRY
ncbi:MAG: aldo/keto reductase [Bryobacterales bacterium]|nr:aldo/keto reductase [Bryobacterales bacterium]